MKLVVQLPALNESATIADVIARIPADLPGITQTAVVVVDDGSSDGTGDLARAAGATVVRHEESRGVGAAFRTGVEASTKLGADIIVTMDADGQFNPDDIPRLIQPILDGEADFVTASRFMDPALIPEMPGAKIWGNRVIARWISKVIGRKFHDVSCGFRAYSRNAFLRLVLLGEFTYTHETFICLAFARVPMKEVPVKIRGVREYGKSRVANNLFNYGRRTASIILRSYRDYRPLRFFLYPGLIFGLTGGGFIAFLLYHRFTSGLFSPHKWAGFVGASFILLGLLFVILGVLADMLDRIRFTQEEIVFRLRKMEIEAMDERR